ncbi:MAG: hypothetical protein HMLKMBBP_01380 [Planctomycetes bacterium]|nr:hypothetical protein [Planctomycetota bacterium]
MTLPGRACYARSVRTLLRIAASALVAACLFLAAAAGAAEGDLDLTMKSGAGFKGRITSHDATGFALKGADGEVRLKWADLDERSWLAAKRTVTDPKDGAALLALGAFAAEKGFRTDAEALLASAEKAAPALKGDVALHAPRIAELRRGEAEALLAKAKEHVGAKRWLQALGRYRDALALDPKSAKAQNGVGEAYFYMRKLPEARKAMEAAAALDPGFKDARLNLAFLELLELDFAACLKGLEEVIALPVDAGRAGTRPDLAKLAGQRKELTQEQAWEQLADSSAIQARDLEPFIREIVKGSGMKTEYRAVSEHYDLRTEVSQEYADLLVQRLEMIYAEYERRFGYSATGEQKTRGKGLRFPVLVFNDKKGYVEWFTRVLRNPQMGQMSGGVYVSMVKHLVFFRYEKIEDTQLVAWHEGFHQYLDYFIEGAPHWFNEGQAEYFGPSRIVEGKKRLEVGCTNPWRIGVIAQLLRTNRVPEAKWLMQTDAQTFMRVKTDPKYADKGTTVGDHYALGWALVHYCIEGEKGRWQKTFLNYFKLLCDGCSHEEAFERAWGRTSWAAFQSGFEAHCKWLVDRAQGEGLPK